VTIPQTKDKVERSIGVVRESFWPSMRFTDLVASHRGYDVYCLASNRPFFVGDSDAQDLRGGPDRDRTRDAA
jgi:hypothetical protein